MAADSGGKDRDLKKRMKSDPYFTYAIKECYASFKNIIYALVTGPREREYVSHSALLAVKAYSCSKPVDKIDIIRHTFSESYKRFSMWWMII